MKSVVCCRLPVDGKTVVCCLPPKASLAESGLAVAWKTVRQSVCQFWILAGVFFALLPPASAQTDLLSKPNSELRNDPMATEMILDMVDVWVADSILPRKREHHHVPGGFMWPLVGIKWQRIRETKQKYVGTIQRFDIGHRRVLTENDVNFDVASHLPKYQRLAFEGYEVQKEIGRAKRRIDYNATPFDSLPTEDNWNRYTLHCEVTPPRDRLDLLDSLFFPTKKGSRLEDHPNFGTVNRQIGVYGAFCSDCNHTCHPEIHPYEWIWWLDLTQPDSIKKWYFAFFKEGSNRFPKWSKKSFGWITIPFAIPLTTDSLSITVVNGAAEPRTWFHGRTSALDTGSPARDPEGAYSFEAKILVTEKTNSHVRGVVRVSGNKNDFAGSLTFSTH
jgi:hypothetical protein